jgi:hypothetical protein
LLARQIRPNRRPANRRNPVMQFMKHIRKIQIIIFWEGYVITAPAHEAKFHSVFHSRTWNFVVKHEQSINHWGGLNCAMSKKTCSHSCRIRRCNPLSRHSADPCGNIRQPNTARIH